MVDKKCVNCQHFRVLYEPIGKGSELWELGRATCDKHTLFVDFSSRRQLNKLTCKEVSP